MSVTYLISDTAKLANIFSQMCDKILKIVVRANNITLLAPNPRLLTNAERQKRPRRPGGSKDYGAATDYKETRPF